MAKRASMIAALLLTMAGTGPVFSAEAGEGLIVSDRDCQAFESYVPDPSVTYQPGTNVHGQAVAPADLGEGLQITPDVNIPITVDVRPWTEVNRHGHGVDRRNGRPNGPGHESEAWVGIVNFIDGKLYFNGQPLDSVQEHAVQEACAAYLRKADGPKTR